MQTVTPARRNDARSPSGSAWTNSSSPTEVYDIGDEEEVGPISSAVRSLDVDGDAAGPDRWMPWTVERTPDGAESTAPSAGDANPTKEADAWSMEDWDSQLARLREMPTPCRVRVPEAADSKQEEVADAVRAELQVDMEALVNAAMDEMRTWVSQEIAFARNSFKEDARAALQEDQSSAREAEVRKELQELKQSLEKLQEGPEKMRKELQEHSRLLKRLEESSHPERGATSSDRVAEARAVAEERKWRLRLENLERSLARNSENIETCLQKTSQLEERASANDADLQTGLSTLQSADARISEIMKELKQRQSDKQAEDLRSLERQQQICEDLEALKASFGSAQQRLEQRLNDESLQAQRSVFELTTAQRNQKEEILSFSTCLAEMQGAVAQGKTQCLALDERMERLLGQLQEVLQRLSKQEAAVFSTSERAQTMHSDLEGVSAELATVTARVVQNLAAMEDLNNRRCALESRTSKLEQQSLRMQALEREVATSEREMLTVQDCLERHEERLACQSRASESLEQQLQHAAASIKDIEKEAFLERRELRRLADEVTSHGKQIEATCLEATEQAKARAGFQRRFEDQEDQMQRLEERLSNLKHQNDSLLDQGCNWEEEIKSGSARIEDLEAKSEQLEKELESARHEMKGVGGLQSDVEKLQLDSSNWREAMQRIETAAATNVSQDDLKQMHAELQNWITDTRQALDRWLSASLDRFQKEQGWALQRNQGWAQRVKHWIEQIHIREQGLSHVILHIIQEAGPETVKLLEQALKLPAKPTLTADAIREACSR
ncbi:unnamed protein product [Effrenium voratum]|uniref:Uncharacterized protein n=1 Tax=Effrenium voratum TaxID=2562239 RepID=A0AA36N9D5_9DINO|nr:unnamed protein product [Effrenium voratum]